LEGAFIPKRPEVQREVGVSHLRTLDLHVRALKRAFEKAQKRLVIVSPFLRWRAVEADDICSKTKSACDRGVQVDIYVDSEFNENLTLQTASEAAVALKNCGANIHVCHNIHSKLICLDDDVFIEGSFNWLSSERDLDEYTRYETSMVYTGKLASIFIEEVMEDIEKRVIFQFENSIA
jgi:phosphatidylserine/phosphatidylglycerophosphate/cardiolipin synthase-like enzyme